MFRWTVLVPSTAKTVFIAVGLPFIALLFSLFFFLANLNVQMEHYMQLLEDKRAGRITEADYNTVLRHLNLRENAKKTSEQQKKKSTKPKRVSKKPPLTTAERVLRGALRPITKWLFDGELFRANTPLFVGVGDSEAMQMHEFIKISNKVIQLSAYNTIIASQRSRVLVRETIQDIVLNRRRNVRNSRKPNKPGKVKKKPAQVYLPKEETPLCHLQ